MGRYRPWIAAVLALAVAGLGHAYLRRWRRAFVWFAWIFGTGLVLTAVFADSAAGRSAVLSPEILLPLLLLFALSAADAFRIGRTDLREATAVEDTAGDVDGSDEGVACPHCGKTTDPELDFCTWCTEPISRDRADDDRP